MTSPRTGLQPMPASRTGVESMTALPQGAQTAARPPVSPHWPAGHAIRPSADPDSASVELTDTVTGRRFRWRPAALAEHILAQGTAPLPPDGDPAAPADERDRLTEGWRHWQRRGWHPSGQAYVASRRWSYADTDDPGDTIRTRTLEHYLTTEGEPPAEQLPDGPVVPLGVPEPPGAQPVSVLLARRRSGRAYTPGPVPLAVLSGLLWHGLADVRARRARTSAEQPLSYLDSYGSAWDFHLCAYGVEGLDPGTYRYDVERHELRAIRPGDHRAAMTDVLQGMHSPVTAAWTLGLVADFPRYQWRYRHEHGLRRLWIEAGVIGQELIVLGGSYGLGTLVTPAQKDRPYLDLHGLDDRRYACVYTLTMGGSLGLRGIDFNGAEVTHVPPTDDARTS
ncbi:SagB/ThcOx family dehydrogenase [Streptomyces sp. NPDC048282]|uniref:SagB/ThcOx family dehydrogenase n=1 Tax=Streptomyces sp. NPDC048282 TaxID=3365528 RepID=UPI00371E8A37